MHIFRFELGHLEESDGECPRARGDQDREYTEDALVESWYGDIALLEVGTEVEIGLPYGPSILYEKSNKRKPPATENNRGQLVQK